MTGFEIAAIVSAGVNVLQWVFGRKRKKTADLLPVVIEGVESFAVLPDTKAKDAGARIKAHIKELATAAGVEADLNRAVKARTADPEFGPKK